MAVQRRRKSPARRREKPIVIEDPTKCYNCKKVGLETDIKYCPYCGFPQGKDDRERKTFLLDQRKKRSALDEENENINRAKNFLYFLGIINYLFMLAPPEPWSIVSSFVIGSSYVTLGYLTPKRPFVCLLTALIIYVSLALLTLVVSPIYLLPQLAAKVIVIGGLSFGMNSAIKAEKLQKELMLAKAQ